MAVEITVEYRGFKLKLTPEEARELRDALNQVVPDEPNPHQQTIWTTEGNWSDSTTWQVVRGTGNDFSINYTASNLQTLANT